MIYLDSCILIYRLEASPEFRLPVVEAMQRAAMETFCIDDPGAAVKAGCFEGCHR